MTCLLFCGVQAIAAEEAKPTFDDFKRHLLASLDLKAGITSEQAKALASWDVLGYSIYGTGVAEVEDADKNREVTAHVGYERSPMIIHVNKRTGRTSSSEWLTYNTPAELLDTR
ncbi:hypothetical protein IGB42_01909 [Andreprevotia sp. IGB-42]|uniref:hypothetical protein n=1 Tax=Andreprevotia sp. IGB-42 TaxID=2497473 RepID=UPI001356A4E3|nr:hypothetical protein [Andreprevotia sp. IGB-42]KAF0813558.1 hypothetical protein IGB42_01909 [Andreprevotia sp. IGB-42]